MLCVADFDIPGSTVPDMILLGETVLWILISLGDLETDMILLGYICVVDFDITGRVCARYDSSWRYLCCGF